MVAHTAVELQCLPTTVADLRVVIIATVLNAMCSQTFRPLYCELITFTLKNGHSVPLNSGSRECFVGDYPVSIWIQAMANFVQSCP